MKEVQKNTSTLQSNNVLEHMFALLGRGNLFITLCK
jgi:hypothetical protein